MADAALLAKVEAFLSENPEVDENAGNQLKECAPELIEAVLKRGDISTARNKSAALIARIRDARYAVEAQVAAPSSDELQKFFEENPDVDETAQEELRKSEGYVQRAVIDRGSIRGAKNPSGALISRIKQARQDAQWGIPAQGPAPTDAEIDRFFSENPDIDERAQEELRKSAGYVQRAVIDRGRMDGVKNPSGTLIARIRDAKQGGGGGWGGDSWGMWDPWSAMMMMGKGGKGKGGGKGKKRR